MLGTLALESGPITVALEVWPVTLALVLEPATVALEVGSVTLALTVGFVTDALVPANVTDALTVGFETVALEENETTLALKGSASCGGFGAATPCPVNRSSSDTPGSYRNERFTTTSDAPTAVASVSLMFAVIANPIPLANSRPTGNVGRAPAPALAPGSM